MTRRPFFVGVAFVLAVTCNAIGVRLLLDDPEHVQPEHVQPDHVQPDHVERPMAGASAPLPLTVTGGGTPGAVIEWIEGVARAQWFAGVELAEREAQQAREAAARSVSGRSGAGGGSCAGDVACFLECTRAHESDTAGGYGAVSSTGLYRGAYQFLQATWDAAVAGAGHDEYVGVPPDQAPPEIQDAAAAHLYSVSGTRPWGGRC